jgi:hypothetical protein
MKNILFVLSLLFIGCNRPTFNHAIIDTRFTVAEAEQITNAIDDFNFEFGTDITYEFSNKKMNVIKSTEYRHYKPGSTGANNYGPTWSKIYLHTGSDVIYFTMLHELGHATTKSTNHIKKGNVMSKNGAHHFYTETDIKYISENIK